jgi:hypothetical protein
MRRVSPIAPNPGDGLLTEPTPAVRPWSWERVFMPEAVGKNARAKNAQHCFLYCPSPIAVGTVFIFQNDEIEKDFLRAV